VIGVRSADREQTAGTNQPTNSAQELAGIVVMFNYVVRDHRVISLLQNLWIGVGGHVRIVSGHAGESILTQVLDEDAGPAAVVEDAIRIANALPLQQSRPIAVADTLTECQRLFLEWIVRVVRGQIGVFLTMQRPATGASPDCENVLRRNFRTLQGILANSRASARVPGCSHKLQLTHTAIPSPLFSV